MVTSAEPTYVDIPVYVVFRKNSYGIEKLTILEEEEYQKIMSDPDNKEKDEIEVVNSKWAIAGWGIQNKIVSVSQERDPLSNKKEPNWSTYREQRIHNLLKDWDLDLGEGRVPVTAQYISQCPAEIMLAMFNKYEKVTGGDPEEEKKQ